MNNSKESMAEMLKSIANFIKNNPYMTEAKTQISSKIYKQSFSICLQTKARDRNSKINGPARSIGLNIKPDSLMQSPTGSLKKSSWAMRELTKPLAREHDACVEQNNAKR